MVSYYVSPIGNDANPGTEASPYRSLRKALSVSVRFDVINMAAGDYPEVGPAGIYISDLTIIGAGKGMTRLLFSVQDGGIVNTRGFIFGAPGVGFADRLHLTDLTILSYDNSYTVSGSTGMLIERVSATSRYTGGAQAGFYSELVRSKFNIFSECDFEECAIATIFILKSPATRFYNCLFRDRSGSQGLIINPQSLGLAANNYEFIGCVFRDVGGISIGEFTGLVTITHCTFINCSAMVSISALEVGAGGISDPGAGPWVLKNNIFYSDRATSDTAIDFLGTPGNMLNLLTDGNCFHLPNGLVARWRETNISGTVVKTTNYTTLASWAAVDVVGGGRAAFSLQTNPLLVDPHLVPHPNWHLSGGSPCIEAGVDVPLPALAQVDRDGDPRPGGAAPDIGADEEGANTWHVGFPIKPTGTYDFASIQVCHDSPLVKSGDVVIVSENTAIPGGVYEEQLVLTKLLRISTAENESIIIRCPDWHAEPAGNTIRYDGADHTQSLSQLDGDPRGTGERNITIEDGVRGIEIAGGSPRIRGVTIRNHDATSHHASRYDLPLEVHRFGVGQWSIKDRYGRYVLPQAMNIMDDWTWRNMYGSDRDLGQITLADITWASTNGPPYLSVADAAKITAHLTALRISGNNGWIGVPAGDGYGADKDVWADAAFAAIQLGGFTLFNYGAAGSMRNRNQGIPVITGNQSSGKDEFTGNRSQVWAYQPSEGVPLEEYGGAPGTTGSWEDAFTLLLLGYAVAYKNDNVVAVTIGNEIFWGWVGQSAQAPFFPTYALAEVAWSNFCTRAAFLIRRYFPRALVFSNRYAGSLWQTPVKTHLENLVTNFPDGVPLHFQRYGGESYENWSWDITVPGDHNNPPDGPYKVAKVGTEAAAADVWCINNYRNTQAGGPGGNNWYVVPAQIDAMAEAVDTPCWISEMGFMVRTWFYQAHAADPANFMPDWVPPTGWEFIHVADEVAWITAMDHELSTWLENTHIVGLSYYGFANHVGLNWGVWDPSLPRGSEEYVGRMAATRAQRTASITLREATLGGITVLDTVGGAAADVLSAQDGDGGGVWIQGVDVRDPQLENVGIDGNIAEDGGGLAISGLGALGFAESGGVPALKSVTLSDNTATGRGGGGFLENVDLGIQKPLFIEELQTSGNTAGGNGGGLWIGGSSDSRFRVIRARIGATSDGDHSDVEGGGIYFEGALCRVIFQNLLITEGDADGDGGGAYVAGTVTRVMEDGLILENASFQACTAGGDGGGLAVLGPAAIITDDIWAISCTAVNGGGVAFLGTTISSLCAVRNGVHCISNTAIILGGGIYASVPNFEWYTGGDASAVDLSRLWLRSNGAARGGGIYITAPGGWVPEVILSNVLAESNSGSIEGGGVLMETIASAARMVHLTVYGNTGGGIYVDGNAAGGIRNSIVSDQVGGDGITRNGGTCDSDYNDVVNNAVANYSGLGAGGNDISTNPLYVDPTAGDLRLTLSSPCIDDGAAQDVADAALKWVPAVDLSGHPRPDPLLTGTDMGSYEFASSGSATWLVSVETLGPRKLRAHFSNPLLNDTELSRVDNYILDESQGTGVSLEVTEVRVRPGQPTFVDLAINEMTNGEPYSLEALNLTDIFSGSVDGGPVAFAGLGDLPDVDLILPRSTTKVSVRFSEAMDPTLAALTNAASYIFDQNLVASSVVVVFPDEVEVTLTAHMETFIARYTLTVDSALRDSALNTVNVRSGSFASFTGRTPPISTTAVDEVGTPRLAVTDGVVDWAYADLSGSNFFAPSRTYTGFAFNGIWYANGVPTPQRASWADAVGDPQGPDRGVRRHFPPRVHVVLGRRELVIFNADDLVVWMRFRLGSSGTGSALGLDTDRLLSVAVDNGIIAVGTTEGARVISFRSDHCFAVSTDGVTRPRDTGTLEFGISQRNSNHPDGYYDYNSADDEVLLTSRHVSDVAVRAVRGHTYVVCGCMIVEGEDEPGGLAVLRIAEVAPVATPPFVGEPDQALLTFVGGEGVEVVMVNVAGQLHFSSFTPTAARQLQRSVSAWTAVANLDPDAVGLGSGIGKIYDLSSWGVDSLFATDVGVFLVRDAEFTQLKGAPEHLYGATGSEALYAVLGTNPVVRGVSLDPESGSILLAGDAGLLEIDPTIHLVSAKFEFPTLPHLAPLMIRGFRNASVTNFSEYLR